MHCYIWLLHINRCSKFTEICPSLQLSTFLCLKMYWKIIVLSSSRTPSSHTTSEYKFTESEQQELLPMLCSFFVVFSRMLPFAYSGCSLVFFLWYIDVQYSFLWKLEWWKCWINEIIYFEFCKRDFNMRESFIYRPLSLPSVPCKMNLSTLPSGGTNW